MNTRPILFSSSMIRAILDGRKSQTRRVVKGSINGLHHNGWPLHELRSYANWPLSGLREVDPDAMVAVFDIQCAVDDTRIERVRCPYGTIGDRIWVRETWAVERCCDDESPSQIESHYPVTYLADAPRDQMHAAFQGKSRPSIFMPRWASRITMEITGIRVERVQDISEADARAEGMLPNWVGDPAEFDPDEHGYLPFDADEEGNVPGCDPYDSFTARDCFARLWDSINGAKAGASFEANPWVWIVEFKRAEGEAPQ